MMAVRKSSNLWQWVAAVAVVAVWAETFVSSKVLLSNGLAPADIFFFRFILAYVFIWVVSHDRLFASSLKDELVLVSLGVTGGSLYFLAENTALAYSTASNVAILVGSAPLLTALLVAFGHKEERMRPRQVIGSVIAFIGMAMVVLNGKFVLKLNPVGDALALGAAFIWALYSLLIKRVSGKYDVRFITRKVFFYGVITISVYFIAVEPLHFEWNILSRPVVWGNLAYLGLVASLMCFLVWNWALERLGTVRATNLIYGQSFFTMIVAHIVLAEPVTWMAVLGTVILIAGMLNAVKS